MVLRPAVSASSGNLIEMQILCPTQDLLKLQGWGSAMWLLTSQKTSPVVGQLLALGKATAVSSSASDGRGGYTCSLWFKSSLTSYPGDCPMGHSFPLSVFSGAGSFFELLLVWFPILFLVRSHLLKKLAILS